MNKIQNSKLLNRKLTHALFKEHGKQIGEEAIKAVEELVRDKIASICSSMGGSVKRINVADVIALNNVKKRKVRLVKRGLL